MSKHTMKHGSRHSGRRSKVLGVTVALVAIGGTAFAYWTTTGTGVGSAGTGTPSAVTVIQTSSVTGLAPGSGTQDLSGTIDNPNSGPVYITKIVAVVTAVNDAAGNPIVGCGADDYTIAGTGVVGADVPANDTGTWTNLTIAFKNTTANQDLCKLGRVVIGYTAS